MKRYRLANYRGAHEAPEPPADGAAEAEARTRSLPGSDAYDATTERTRPLLRSSAPQRFLFAFDLLFSRASCTHRQGVIQCECCMQQFS